MVSFDVESHFTIGPTDEKIEIIIKKAFSGNTKWFNALIKKYQQIC